MDHRTYLEPRSQSQYGIGKYRAVCSNKNCSWVGPTTIFSVADKQAEGHMELQPLRDKGLI